MPHIYWRGRARSHSMRPSGSPELGVGVQRVGSGGASVGVTAGPLQFLLRVDTTSYR